MIDPSFGGDERWTSRAHLTARNSYGLPQSDLRGQPRLTGQITVGLTGGLLPPRPGDVMVVGSSVTPRRDTADLDRGLLGRQAPHARNP